MEKESRYIKKRQEMAVPFEKKSRTFKIVAWVSGIVLAIAGIVCTAYFLNIFPLLGFLALGRILFVVFSAKSAKASFMAILQGAEFAIDQMKDLCFTAEEIDEFDRIMDDVEAGIYTFKVGDVMVTFTPTLMVCVDNNYYLEVCRASDITRVLYYICNGEWSFDFDGIRGSSFSIDFDLEKVPEGGEKVLEQIKQHYPNIELLQRNWDEDRELEDD